MPGELHRMIRCQPGVLDQLAGLDVAAHADGLAAAGRIVIAGTGTSFHAAELAASLLRSGGADAAAVPSAAAARWYPAPRDGTAYVIISHTGATAYARSLRQAVREAGCCLVSITGPDSGWDEAIRTPVAEASETYTVSYTAALAVLGLIAHRIAGTPTGPEQLARTAAAVGAAIAGPQVAGIPVPQRAIAITGPGPWSVTAREGALKIREGAHILAEGFDPERLLHGAAVPYGPGDLLIGLQPDADADGLTGQLLGAARAEGITVHVLGDGHGDLHPYLRQLPATARLQLLAWQLSSARGTNPDVAITGAWARDTLWSAGGTG